MLPYDLTISGFKSFRNRTCLRFGGKFTLVSGPNGAGKSAIWDALTWCLYGRSALGGRTPAVGSWAGAKPKVSFRFKLDDQPHRVTRKAKGKQSLRLDGKEVEQQAIDTLLRVDYDRWLHTYLMGQFGVFFFDLSAAQKLEVLSDLLRLSLWQNASEQAKVLVANYTAKEAELSAALATHHAGVNLTAQQYEQWAAESVAVEDRSEELQSTIKDYDRAKDRLKAARKVVGKATRKADKARRRALDASKRQDAAAVIMQRLEGDLNACYAEIRSLKQTKASARSTHQCPTCKQPLVKEKEKAIVEDYKSRLDWARGEREAMQAKLAKAARSYRKLKRKVKRLLNVYDLSNAKADTGRRVMSDLEEYVGRLGGTIGTIKRSAQAQRDRERTYSRQGDEILNSHLEHQGCIADLERKLRRMQQRRAACEHWVKGFKDLRLSVIDDALQELKVDINNAMSELGLHGWTVDLQTERETKAGHVVYGFVVMVKSPQAAKAMPWAEWSGGEKQRLKIAGAIGFAELIRRRTGLVGGFEVWDEPTSYLSNEGVEDLLKYFVMRADTRPIYLVDHRSLDSGLFDRRVTVEVGKDGSSIK